MIGAVQVQMHIDDKVLRTYLGKVSYGGLRRAGEETVNRAKRAIAKGGRIRTGNMYFSVNASRPVETRSGLWITEISAPTPYTDFQRFGIGPVYPVRAKALRFRPKGSAFYVFAKRTRGFEGLDFLKIAARQIRLSDFT